MNRGDLPCSQPIQVTLDQPTHPGLNNSVTRAGDVGVKVSDATP
jgi:hypothetical protein